MQNYECRMQNARFQSLCGKNRSLIFLSISLVYAKEIDERKRTKGFPLDPLLPLAFFRCEWEQSDQNLTRESHL